MRPIRFMLFAALAAAAVVGCTSTLHGKQLAEYCAIERNQGKDLCAVNSEIQGVRADLAATTKTANDALSLAQSKNMACQTITLRHTASASCAAGYTLMGCTQTHYTKRAGGMAIIRAIDDQQCTFNSKVLEVQARCCMVGAPTQTAMAEPAPETPAPPAPPKPTS
ncbi:MAG TPA: hypothetical protein VG983_10275 [Caulobacterales bacterium]|jgi:hypothetical protein|nr:hypothetical protein [Caulobacterales bacterium]